MPHQHEQPSVWPRQHKLLHCADWSRTILHAWVHGVNRMETYSSLNTWTNPQTLNLNP